MTLHRLVVAVTLAGGCYGPSIEPCAVACGSGGSCPSGLECFGELCATGPNQCGGETDGGGPVGDGGLADARVRFSDPTPVTELNSELNEDDPTLTGDMTEMYFAREGAIMVAHRSPDQDVWDSAIEASELEELNAQDESPEITPDGLVIYFQTDRGGNADIYRSWRPDRSTPWAPPLPVMNVSTNLNDISATPTPDESALYICADGEGVFDIYLARFETAMWTDPVVVDVLSGSGQDCNPWIDADETVVFFGSTRTTGNYDIHVSKRTNRDESWGEPLRLDELATDALDEDAWVSADGRTIYFSSNRSGSRDIFVSHR